MDENNWRIYERLIAAFEAENSGLELSVTPNAQLIGRIRQTSRQIDVLVDARWDDDLARRVIIDAKLHKAKLDINNIESFEGMMKDCGAERGILVCPNGWTSGAQKRAQDAITIKLLSLEELQEQTLWASFDFCEGKCRSILKKRSLEGLVLWDAQHLLLVNGLLAIIYTGKCDVCHNFHLWCWDCGEKFALSNEMEYQCYCERLWVTAIEEETDDEIDKTVNSKLNAVHLFLIVGQDALPLDRRRLR